MYTENTEQFRNKRFDIPTTEEEGFKILDQIYPLEEKRMALDKTKEEFTGDEHFELGMWIRNNWIHRPEIDDPVLTQRSDACYAMLSGEEDTAYPFRHYDDLSSDFLAKYYDHLKATCRINEPVEEIQRKPRKCPHCGGKVLRIQYGHPGPELFEAADRGEILLGGCILSPDSPDSPDYACPTCGQAFRRPYIIDD